MFTIDHKRGDTISWEVYYTDDLGAPIDISSYSIKIEAREKRNPDNLLFSTTSVTKYNAAEGQFRLLLDTDSFTVGRYLVDIQYSMTGLVKSSDTFELNILDDITK